MVRLLLPSTGKFVDSIQQIATTQRLGDVIVHTRLQAAFTITDHCKERDGTMSQR
jgi:hypothetical protein